MLDTSSSGVCVCARANNAQSVLSVLCAMFQLQLSFLVNLLNVFLIRLPNFSLNFCYPSGGPSYYRYFMFHIHPISIHYSLLFITFMEDIYNYIPEANHVCRIYSVAAIL
jgi:hypothetical protein